MLKITKNEMINEDMIESIMEYKTTPLKTLVKNNVQENIIRRFRGRYGVHSLIILEDGSMFLCPSYPYTYCSKLEDVYFAADYKRFFLRSCMIREISCKLNAAQRKEVMEKKENGLYILLTRGKKTKFYIFMKSGRIYGVNSLKLRGDDDEK